MEKTPRSRRRGTALLGLGLAVAFCFTPTDNLAPASVAIHVGGDAWACGGPMSPPDPMCPDPDSDGDGKPDSRDACPQDPDPNCNTIIVYGDRSHLPVTCSDGTRVADVNECPNYYAASGDGNGGSQDDDDSSAGRGGGGGGGGSRSRVARSPAPPATAGASIAEDVDFVKACAHEGLRGAPEHIFDRALRRGKVNVSYGDAGTGDDGNPAQGWAVRTGASVSITMDFEDIKYNGGEVGRNYWRQFARVLLHEYHHAYDMLSCKCANPHVGKKLTRQQYEDETWRKADDDFDLLFGGANAACLAD